MEFAIYYSSEAYSTNGKELVGRRAAGASFLRAVANTKPERLYCCALDLAHAKRCEEALAAFGSPQTRVEWVSFLDANRLSGPGLLYRPDPGIMSDAWRRLTYATPRSYSICGVTHTTASHPVMDAIARMPSAPLEDWDAIVCTSLSVRDSIRCILDNEAEYLRERLGATRLVLPQLPVIPLGVHTSDFAFTPEQRDGARAELGIAADEVVVLFLGRLSYLDKASPVGMYVALEACAREHKITLIEAGWFGSEQIEKEFKEDATVLSPSVRHVYLDARDPKQRGQAWAAADIFTSLADNIQETFGLTPVEAMAAGLPVVVSDWNGYKDTIRNNIDGFRIPTLSMPAGTGQPLADLYELQAYGYHRYCGSTAQLVAVDVEAATAAYRKLVLDRDLRAKMGEAGRQRARAEFDWSVIFRRYLALWDELTERRRAGPALFPPLKRRPRPERGDPFTVFASYPTGPIGDATLLRLRSGASAETAVARRELKTTQFARPMTPPPQLIEGILSKLSEDVFTSFGNLIARWPMNQRRPLFASVIWLAKMGLIEFKLPERSLSKSLDQVRGVDRPPV